MQVEADGLRYIAQETMQGSGVPHGCTDSSVVDVSRHTTLVKGNDLCSLFMYVSIPQYVELSL